MSHACSRPGRASGRYIRAVFLRVSRVRKRDNRPTRQEGVDEIPDAFDGAACGVTKVQDDDRCRCTGGARVVADATGRGRLQAPWAQVENAGIEDPALDGRRPGDRPVEDHVAIAAVHASERQRHVSGRRGVEEAEDLGRRMIADRLTVHVAKLRSGFDARECCRRIRQDTRDEDLVADEPDHETEPLVDRSLERKPLEGGFRADRRGHRARRSEDDLSVRHAGPRCAQRRDRRLQLRPPPTTDGPRGRELEHGGRDERVRRYGVDHDAGDALGHMPDRVGGGIRDQRTPRNLLASRALVGDELAVRVCPFPAPSGPDLDEVAPRALDHNRLLGMSHGSHDELVLPGPEREPGERAGGKSSDAHLVHGHVDCHGAAGEGVRTVDEDARDITRGRRELCALVEIVARDGHARAGTQSHEQGKLLHRNVTVVVHAVAQRATGAPGVPSRLVDTGSRSLRHPFFDSACEVADPCRDRLVRFTLSEVAGSEECPERAARQRRRIPEGRRGAQNTEAPRTLRSAGPLMSDELEVPGPGIEPGTRGFSVPCSTI